VQPRRIRGTLWYNLSTIAAGRHHAESLEKRLLAEQLFENLVSRHLESAGGLCAPAYAVSCFRAFAILPPRRAMGDCGQAIAKTRKGEAYALFKMSFE